MMIRKWAKWLPYWVLVRVVKKYSPMTINFNDTKVKAWRLDDGEWIVWNQDNYDALQKNRQSHDDILREKRKDEYNKLKKEFDD